MRPARSRRSPLGSRGVRSLGALTVGTLVSCLLAGCPSTPKPETTVPIGPSEEHEVVDQTVIDAGMADDADDAAKQAAAQEVLQKVNDRDPEEEKKKLTRSRAISSAAQAQLDKGNLTEAVHTAREALKVHEQNVDAMLVLGQVFYRQGKYELVLAVTSSALQVDAKTRSPEDTSRAYNLQGFAMVATGEEVKATLLFKKAAEVDDKNASAWNNLGTRYLAAGDVGTATACFEYALELDPRFHKAHLNYGAALRAQRKWEDAEASMRKSLELRPGYAEAYFNLGVLYLDADPFPGLETVARLNKAIQHLAKYRELAIADGGARPGPSGPGMSSGKAPPPRVSKERADDYIRVAKKGIEREERRLEREKERQAKAGAAGGDPTGGDPAGGEPAGGDPTAAGAGAAGSDPAVAEDPAPDDAGPSAPDDAGPEQPAPQGPSPQGPQTPSKPAPQGPSKPAPSTPAPSTPAPSTPAPSTPAPSKPAPQGPSTPAPSKPAPQGPSTQAPSKPAPQGPSTPAPSKPAPQGPSTQGPTPQPPPPASPSPQKPSVQKPQSASLRLPSFAGRLTKKVPGNPASRGTRFIPSTLIPTEVGAPVPGRVATLPSSFAPISCRFACTGSVELMVIGGCVDPSSSALDPVRAHMSQT